MELLTGRLPFELEEGEENEPWEALSTGRSSNEGCEAWVAHPDGGFRLKGTPPTPVQPAASEQTVITAAAPKERAHRKGRGKSKERRASRSSSSAVDPAPRAPEDADTQLESNRQVVATAFNDRRKEAAASVASAISSALKLTPGTKQLVARAAELGAAAAMALPPTPLEDEKEEPSVLGDVSNRDGKKGKGGGKKGKKGKRVFGKKEKEPSPVDLSA